MADPSQLMSLPQQVAAAPSDMTAIYLLVGMFVVKELLAFGSGFVKGLASRTVEREDRDKQALQKKVDELEKKFDDRFEEQDDQLNELERSVDRANNELKQVRDTLESIRGAVVEVRSGLDSRLEKQADFYRAQTKEYVVGIEKKIEDLEHKLRQDMARAVGDVMRETRSRRQDED